MKIPQRIAMAVLVIVSLYLMGSFVAASFILTEWSDGGRLLCGVTMAYAVALIAMS